MKTIQISCKGADTTCIDNLTALQGNLKTLTKDNYDKLRKEILELGFSEPISVWNDNGVLKTINGHQRLHTLKTMRDVEGYLIPEIPINYIEASSEKEAKKKVLSLTSQYGEMTRDGLYEFMNSADLNMEDIETSFRFPEINMDYFKVEYFETQQQIDTVELNSTPEQNFIIMECPHCNKSFEKSQAKVINKI